MKSHFLTVVAAACALVCATPYAASQVEIHHNPDQYHDFQCENCTHKTTVDKGETNIYITCYGQKTGGPEQAGYWAASCSSPEAGITCSWSQGNSNCTCHSDTPKAHTVKMHMGNPCPPNKAGN